MSNSILTLVLQQLSDIKAEDVITIDVQKQTTVTDYMVICTGRSSRHVKSIADYVVEHLKPLGVRALSQHGLSQGDWALIDFGEVIVHVMQAETRAFYNLEDLWQPA